MTSNITVDGCDYTLRLDDTGEWWQVVTADGDLLADFQSAEISGAAWPTNRPSNISSIAGDTK